MYGPQNDVLFRFKCTVLLKRFLTQECCYKQDIHSANLELDHDKEHHQDMTARQVNMLGNLQEA